MGKMICEEFLAEEVGNYVGRDKHRRGELLMNLRDPETEIYSQE